MSLWDKLLSNEVLISALVGWTVAQFLKTVPIHQRYVH